MGQLVLSTKGVLIWEMASSRRVDCQAHGDVLWSWCVGVLRKQVRRKRTKRMQGAAVEVCVWKGSLWHLIG